jgi:phage antirepressor YoqD-like protein
MAKLLGEGRNNLFKFLREQGILISKRREYNLPYQMYVNQGYFETRENVIDNGEIKQQSMITSKGQKWISKIYYENQQRFLC